MKDGTSMRQGLGTCSSGFMPGHRIDNQLLRPHSGNREPGARTGSHGASGSADGAQDRLPKCWTQYENNCGWETPDWEEHQEEFFRNMLSSFSAIGEGLEQVQDKLSSMAPVTPMPSALSRADCEVLRKTALGGTLEWVLACIMMHHHSKLLVCKVCLDTVSPFVNSYDADNMHARLFRSLNFSCIQKANMARVWREWQRHKKALDKQQEAVLSQLSSTVKIPPLPEADVFVINAIAEGLLPWGPPAAPPPPPMPVPEQLSASAHAPASLDSQPRAEPMVFTSGAPPPREDPAAGYYTPVMGTHEASMQGLAAAAAPGQSMSPREERGARPGAPGRALRPPASTISRPGQGSICYSAHSNSEEDTQSVTAPDCHPAPPTLLHPFPVQHQHLTPPKSGGSITEGTSYSQTQTHSRHTDAPQSARSSDQADHTGDNNKPFDPSAPSKKASWPGIAGQCAWTTASMCTALEELRRVRNSDGRLYEDFIELRLHPSEIMDANQLMVIYSEHLKLTCPPADTMVLCEISYLQMKREEVFEGISELAL